MQTITGIADTLFTTGRLLVGQFAVAERLLKHGLKGLVCALPGGGDSTTGEGGGGLSEATQKAAGAQSSALSRHFFKK